MSKWQSVEKETIMEVSFIVGIRGLMVGRAEGCCCCLDRMCRGRGDMEEEGDGQMRFLEGEF